MANVKISALPTITTITGTELVPVVQGGVTKSATVNQLLALVLAASGVTVTDNGDGTLTINGTTTAGSVTVTAADNGDGTYTITGATATDNGDGTFTSTSTVVDNGDGTFTLS